MFEVRPVAVSAAEYAQVTGQSFGGAPPVLPGSAVSPSTGSRIGFGLEPYKAFVGHPRVPCQAAHRCYVR